MKINMCKSFGSQVKYYRVKNNVKQTELASILNVTREVILNLENKDKRLYNIDNLNKILNIVDKDNELKINDKYVEFILSNPSKKIRLYRKRYNLNKKEFAKLIGVHYKTVRCWETGKNIISKKICKPIEFYLEFYQILLLQFLQQL